MSGVWAELMSDDEVARALPDLAALGLHLGLALPVARLGDASFAALTRRATDLGVPVRAWLLLDREDGYWIHEAGMARFAESVDELLRWRRSPSGPALQGLSVDLEPAYEHAEALRAARGQLTRWLSLLRAHVDARAFEHARGRLARTVDHARAQGLYAHAVTYPLVLDQRPGSVAFEDALDVPVSGIDWDEVSFMVYQTAFAQQAGHWLGPSLVASYALDAVARWGERAGLDLGVVGDAGLGLDPGQRYAAPAVLHEDVAAALAAGIDRRRLRVYGLAGAIGAGGVPPWLDLARVAPGTPAPAPEVTGLRNGLGLAAAWLEHGR